MLTAQTYSIVGMKCGRCAAEVTKRLHSIEGVIAAHVDFTTSTVEVLMHHPIGITKLRSVLHGTDCRVIKYVAPAEDLEYQHWITSAHGALESDNSSIYRYE